MLWCYPWECWWWEPSCLQCLPTSTTISSASSPYSVIQPLSEPPRDWVSAGIKQGGNIRQGGKTLFCTPNVCIQYIQYGSIYQGEIVQASSFTGMEGIVLLHHCKHETDLGPWWTISTFTRRLVQSRNNCQLQHKYQLCVTPPPPSPQALPLKSLSSIWMCLSTTCSYSSMLSSLAISSPSSRNIVGVVPGLMLMPFKNS